MHLFILPGLKTFTNLKKLVSIPVEKTGYGSWKTASKGLP